MMRSMIPSCLILFVVFGGGCRKKAVPDAYGNVEATEVVVGAESSGKIETFRPHEGARLSAGEIVGTIETTSLSLRQQEVTAGSAASADRLGEVASQIDALQVQRAIARRAFERTRRLYQQRAATAQQLDQTERDYRVLGEQIEGARFQHQAIQKEIDAARSRVAQVNERISKGAIRNPIDGTVLATYVEAGEVTQTGQPLYRIADLRNVEVRAYVTETQLAAVHIGQQAQVTVDTGANNRTVVNGTVEWISSDAEFTPTPIQTREERASLVYAVKIRVANPNGALKLGMPADVDFPGQIASP